MIRSPAAAAAQFGALLLLLVPGASVAVADPTFSLATSAARPGDSVTFSISGTKEGATYAVEVAEREVAEGSDPEGTGIAGSFAMPHLGDASQTVTVRVEVTDSDDRTTLTGRLQYLPPSQEAAGAPATNSAPVPLSPSTQRAPGSKPASDKPKRKHRAPRRPARKRRAKRSPAGTREPPSSDRPRPTRAGPRRPGARSRDSSRIDPGPPSEVISPHGGTGSADKGKPSATGGKKTAPSPQPGGIFGPHLSAPLTTSLATFSPTSSIAGTSGAAPMTAVIVFGLLGLAAMVIANAQRRRVWRGAGVPAGPPGDEDDEILQGVVHVPSPRKPSPHNGKS